MVTDDESVHERVVRGVLRLASEMDLNESPPAMGQRIHRLIRQTTNKRDPYQLVKEQSNRFALQLLPWMRQKVLEATNRFQMAVRLAVAGNILDFGVQPRFEEDRVMSLIDKTLREAIDTNAVKRLQADLKSANRVLYIADNAGETVFDRLLIEQMPRQKLTFVVRGSPVINDATMADARACGLTEVAEIIDNGSDAPGTILADCSPDFRERFAQADLVISKGQGNYETLSDQDGVMWFLLKAKCPVIARDIGCPVGEVVLIRHEGTNQGASGRRRVCPEEAVAHPGGSAR